MSLAWTEFHSALTQLVEPGSQKQRLFGACSNIVRLRRKELPAEVRASFDLLTARLHYPGPAASAAALHQSIDAMSDDEVSTSVADIMHIYDTVTRYMPAGAIARATEC